MIEKFGDKIKISEISNSLKIIESSFKNVRVVFKCKKCGYLITKTSVEKVKKCPCCGVGIV